MSEDLCPHCGKAINAPPWAPLRHLRVGGVDEIEWERFLRDNFQAMEHWKVTFNATWPSVALRFWRKGQQKKPWEPKSAAEVQQQALAIVERDDREEEQRGQ